MSDDILIRVGDGVTQEWTLSPSNTGLKGVTVNGVAAAYTQPVWDKVKLTVVPAPGSQVAFTFTGTEHSSGGGGGGAADGATRVYQFNASSNGYTKGFQEIFDVDTPRDLCLFELSGAKAGDAVTVIIESEPVVPGDVVFVLPAAFDVGTVRVVNGTARSLWVVTANSLGQPFFVSYERTPGVVSVLPGTTELVVVPHLTDQGYKVVQVNSLRALVRPSYHLTERLSAPQLGEKVEFLCGTGFWGDRYLAYMCPMSFGVYSDQPVRVTFEVFAWDSAARAFTDKLAEASWVPAASGDAPWDTIETVLDLPKAQAGNGAYSLLPSACIVRLTLTAFPAGTPPTYVHTALTVSTMADYS